MNIDSSVYRVIVTPNGYYSRFYCIYFFLSSRILRDRELHVQNTVEQCPLNNSYLSSYYKRKWDLMYFYNRFSCYFRPFVGRSVNESNGERVKPNEKKWLVEVVLDMVSLFHIEAEKHLTNFICMLVIISYFKTISTYKILVMNQSILCCQKIPENCLKKQKPLTHYKDFISSWSRIYFYFQLRFCLVSLRIRHK